MFAHGDEFARVDVIFDGGYILARYASREAANTGVAPLESTRLSGSPSVSSCLSALPEGYVDDSSGLPLIASAPASVSARQIRLWLVRNGLPLAAVESAIEAIPDQIQRDSVRVEWEYAPYVERSHPMLVPLAASLGLSEEQVDRAFIEASTI